MSEDDRRVHATIALVDDQVQELSSLYAWLQSDDEFRGRVTAIAKDLRPGEMGGATDALVVALGAGGAISVLVSAVSGWLTARRTRLSIEITDAGRSRRVEIDAANAGVAARLLREAFEVTGGQP
ncbi:hypothetical protein ACIA8K_38465 [Catenuloplanes sp. NPDC051500]|uniref:effector-associated constant component EACC1 n=1 Tax=Catenuloplanes sp. NPDC051500 TaxID=3363959 RepID=UPI00379DD6B3